MRKVQLALQYTRDLLVIIQTAFRFTHKTDTYKCAAELGLKLNVRYAFEKITKSKM